MIDGLETLYCRFPSTALHVIIKAFNSRQHIYVINLTDSYFEFKSRERAQLEMAGDGGEKGNKREKNNDRMEIKKREGENNWEKLNIVKREQCIILLNSKRSMNKIMH